MNYYRADELYHHGILGAGRRYGDKILSEKYGERAIRNLHVEDHVLGAVSAFFY